MRDIDLQAGTIDLNGQPLSVAELTAKIQEKIAAGDLKFSDLAAALEALNIALENSRTIAAKIVLAKADYDKLRECAGADDDLVCVSKAVAAYLGGPADIPAAPEAAADSGPKKKKLAKCAKCKAPIEIPAGETPGEIACPQCGSIGRLKSADKNDVRRQDHFLG